MLLLVMMFDVSFFSALFFEIIFGVVSLFYSFTPLMVRTEVRLYYLSMALFCSISPEKLIFSQIFYGKSKRRK